jgi:sugar phosphate isomerase/epimerase
MTERPLGVVDIVYAARGDEVARAVAAAADGFVHIDPLYGTDPATLALPIGCPTAFPKPVDDWCSTPAPPATLDGAWERAVRWWTRAPSALMEPFKSSFVHSTDEIRAFKQEVPTLRLLVDTGHVADWGGDPVEMLEHADHVQLRQGCRGSTQVHVDDERGVVDFAAVLARLDELEYRGCVSIEYFDLPEQGWPLDDPIAWAADLRTHILSLMP